MLRRKFVLSAIKASPFFLFQSSLTSACSLLETETPVLTDKKIIVIGAGIAGLAAAKKLKENGLSRKLVGFELIEKGIARGHYPVKNQEGEQIGMVTSGTISPSIGKSIGLAYVPVDLSKPGNRIFIDVRGRLLEAEVVSLPFYKS